MARQEAGGWRQPQQSAGISGCFDASGTRYFLRSNDEVFVFAYDPGSGALAQILHFSVPLGDASRSGVEQMAFDDVEDLLWLTTGTELRAYDPTSGALAARDAHVLTAGDSLQSLAYQAYGNPELWRHIAEANGVDDPMRLKLGTTVLVPALEEIQHG